MNTVAFTETQSRIWDFYKPRHTHAWNMLVLAWRHLVGADGHNGFETEYFWENFIIRLWLYRAVIQTLAKLDAVQSDALQILAIFDREFEVNGMNGLKAIRDMVEHFDDYAANEGRNKKFERDKDLDPWRVIDRDRYEREQFLLYRKKSFDAANELRSNSKIVSGKYIDWYKANSDWYQSRALKAIE